MAKGTLVKQKIIKHEYEALMLSSHPISYDKIEAGNSSGCLSQ